MKPYKSSSIIHGLKLRRWFIKSFPKDWVIVAWNRWCTVTWFHWDLLLAVRIKFSFTLHAIQQFMHEFIYLIRVRWIGQMQGKHLFSIGLKVCGIRIQRRTLRILTCFWGAYLQDDFMRIVLLWLNETQAMNQMQSDNKWAAQPMRIKIKCQITIEKQA